MIGTIRSEGPSVALGGASPVSRSTPSPSARGGNPKLPDVLRSSFDRAPSMAISGYRASRSPSIRRSSIPSRTRFVPPYEGAFPKGGSAPATLVRSLGFSRAVRPAPDASIRRSALSTLRSCRRARRFQARRTSLERKENSSRAAGRRLRGRSRLRRNPGSERRSFDRLPFRRRRDRADDASRTKRASIVPSSKLISGLGSANSRPIAVLAKPFSASALKLLA